MAFDSDSLTRRSLGPALASAVIGVVLGVAAIAGIAELSQPHAVPLQQGESIKDPLLGGAEYGSRK
ncbi:DUF2613 family protein [Corynebacterium canis]|uniref:DUF2613 family protein n=1 Tax=Corynebacterium canis TaxID=679663 RepID=A0A5C5UL99_9CORY|nr:DUF2613 domain-containing protein [Corynebacterium canis]TWT26619.1 DUF2613 family protein [Corynebacterium canis]WJY76403.1 hypothetical protein CCANI_12990 [Corynebacterium canis]